MTSWDLLQVQAGLQAPSPADAPSPARGAKEYPQAMKDRTE